MTLVSLDAYRSLQRLNVNADAEGSVLARQMALLAADENQIPIALLGIATGDLIQAVSPAASRLLVIAPIIDQEALKRAARPFIAINEEPGALRPPTTRLYHLTIAVQSNSETPALELILTAHAFTRPGGRTIAVIQERAFFETDADSLGFQAFIGVSSAKLHASGHFIDIHPSRITVIEKPLKPNP